MYIYIFVYLFIFIFLNIHIYLYTYIYIFINVQGTQSGRQNECTPTAQKSWAHVVRFWARGFLHMMYMGKTMSCLPYPNICHKLRNKLTIPSHMWFMALVYHYCNHH